MRLFITRCLLLCAIGITGVFAQTSATEHVAQDPFWAQQGDTVFVSGPLQYWSSRLMDALGKNTKVEGPEKIKRVVFFNATSLRPEVTGGEVWPQKFMRDQNITTVVVGRCDLFCSRYFVGGVSRQFGPDVADSPTHIDIQVPVDYATQQLETKYPQTQFAIYERTIPGILQHKDVMVEALTQGGWKGGLTILAEGDARFCLDRPSEKGCKTHVGANAFSMGFVTTRERASVDLPPGFGDPKTTAFASLNDEKAVPVRKGKKEIKEAYKEFLERPLIYGRAFALSESEDGEYVSTSGTNAVGNAAHRALKLCQERSKSKCRLYAVDDRVVW